MTDDVYRRALADMPTSEQVAAEIVAKYPGADTDGGSYSAWVYAASRYHGLYLEARGLLEALLAATEPKMDVCNLVDPT
jgi:hypothetical protein